MKLRNGKKYSFKHKNKKIPRYVKEIVDYITEDFARACLVITEVDYKIVKYSKTTPRS